MESVIATWMEKSPDDAAGWVSGLVSGPYRDFGHEVIARHFVGSDAGKAWKFVGQVSDFDRKVKLATEVFKEWEKKDQAAAVKAWEELFPPAR